MQKYKICSICEVKLKIADFYKKGSQCKICLKKKVKKYQEENRLKISQKGKRYREENKDKIKERRIRYYENNKDKILAQQKMYAEINKENISKQQKQYRASNKEAIYKKKKNYYKENLEKTKQYQKQYQKENLNKLNEYSRIYQKNKRANDLLFKLRRDFSQAIHKALKTRLSSKEGKSMLKFLPYTMEDLKNHLESLFCHPDNLDPNGQVWMTWDNWGLYRLAEWNNDDPSTWKWNIDHIIPHSTFPYTSMEEENFIKCWSLNNLRPLRADINIKEGSSRIRHGALQGIK